jgi:hypothetical protein
MRFMIMEFFTLLRIEKTFKERKLSGARTVNLAAIRIVNT